jgi:hypothetical protein
VGRLSGDFQDIITKECSHIVSVKMCNVDGGGALLLYHAVPI